MKPETLINTKIETEEILKNKKQGHIIPLSPAEKIIYNGKAQRELYRLYGDPREKGWGNKWMVIWHIKKQFKWFPAERVFIHKEFRAKLTAAFAILEAGGLHQEIKSFDGCYNVRMVRGTETILSVHSWGCAIDLNAAQNPLGGESDWSYDFINVMEHCGIYCGARWPGRPDAMHFALVNG